MTEDFPATRWEQADHRGYGTRFAALVEEGADIEGEARLADALAPRSAAILDAGSGMGRVAAALVARGHRVTAVEKDPALVAQSRATYPEVEVLERDLLGVTPSWLAEHDRPSAYDVIVVVGNVIVLVADDTEVEVLRRFHDLLAPGGRILVGYHLVGGPAHGRPYRPDDFAADAHAAGLQVDHRFDAYDLRPAPPEESGQYVVWVLSARTPPAAPGSTG